MINLLPPAYADSIRYGRINSKLGKWLLAMILAIVGLILILAFGWLYIRNQTISLQKDVDGLNQQLKAQNLDQVKKDAEEISESVKIINQVLSQEVRFSDLIQDIGKVMPPGTVLSSLTLNKLSGGVNLTANARDQASAAQIAANLNDPRNMLFEKVDIVRINCPPESNVSGYKCSTDLRVLFSKTAQNRYLNINKEAIP